MELLSKNDFISLQRPDKREYVNDILKPSSVIEVFHVYLSDSEGDYFLGKVVTNSLTDRNDNIYCFVRPNDPLFLEPVQFFSDNEGDNDNNVHLMDYNNELDEGDWVLVPYELNFSLSQNDRIKRAIKSSDSSKFIKVNENNVKEFVKKMGFQNELQEAKRQIDERKREVEDLTESINSKNDDLGEIIEKIKIKAQEFEEKNAIINGLDNNREALEKIILEKNKEIKILEEFGFEFGSGKKNSHSQSMSYNYTELIKPILDQKIAVEIEAGLEHYQSIGMRVLDRFFSACFTGQLIILSGPSGTGKTTLPKVVAELMGGECIVIPVQPNWTDQQDLFGFYNFMEHRYVSTEFLDCLIEAGNNPEKPYFIVLDEMNLAHIEYYFANFLSKMELRDNNVLQKSDKEDDGRIHLYSDSVDRELKSRYLDELRGIFVDSGIAAELETVNTDKMEDLLDQKTASGKVLREMINDVKEKNTLYQEWLIKYRSFREQMCRFPSSIPLPINVQIVGTINMDDTTKGISPKVLDRSYVIEIPEYQDVEADEKLIGNYMPAENGKEVRTITEQIECIMSFVNAVNECHTLKLRFSKRLHDRFARMVRSVYGESGNCSDDFVDDFILSKILPAARGIRTMIDSGAHEKLMNVVKGQEYSDLKHTIAKIEKMYNEDMQTYDYWE